MRLIGTECCRKWDTDYRHRSQSKHWKKNLGGESCDQAGLRRAKASSSSAGVENGWNLEDPRQLRRSKEKKTFKRGLGERDRRGCLEALKTLWEGGEQRPGSLVLGKKSTLEHALTGKKAKRNDSS